MCFFSWEFQYYTNNRSNSYTRNSILYIKPTLTADFIGEQNLLNGYTLDIWGSSPSNLCTGNAFYGCSRTSGAGGNIINPIQSARLRTINAFSFKYGRMEVRAKLPRGDWIWPAIWMLPRHNFYGEWPASGEIDVVESRGNLKYPGGGCATVGSTLHWGPFFSQDKYQLTHATYTLPNGKTFSDDFHVFGLVWTADGIQTYVNDPKNTLLNVDFTKQTLWDKGSWNSKYANPWAGGGPNAPFDQNFSLVLNVAVGGTTGYWDDAAPGKPWRNTDSHAVNAFWNARNDWYSTWSGEDSALQIDYIKVYELDGTVL